MDLADVSQGAREGNVARLHQETARHHGDATAIEGGETRLTHAEFGTESARFAGALRDAGHGAGEVLLLHLLNGPAYLVGSLGALKAGLAVSPVNPTYGTRELGYQLEDSGASVVLTHAAVRPMLDRALAELDRDPTVVCVEGEADERFADARADPLLCEREDEDVALLPYTSGTTGRPKGVRLTHRNVRAQLFNILAQSNPLDDEATRSLVWLPLYHIAGFMHAAWQPLIRGGRVFVRSTGEWDAQAAMELIEDEAITHFVGVTAMYVDMVEHDRFGEYDLSSLEWAVEGGAKLSGAVQAAFEETAGIDMIEGYGLTETAGATHAQVGSSYGLRPGTVGQPTRLTDCKVLDENDEEIPPGEAGELLVRGPHVMAGYHGRPEATEAAFTDRNYFRTGDIVRRDAENYYEIVDRKTDMIVSAGYNIYPSELEELLIEHEGVADGAVVGVPDERRNEVPKAFVVTSSEVEPGQDITAEEIREQFLEQLANYKHPREVEFVDSLPRTTSGKVQKYKLTDE